MYGGTLFCKSASESGSAEKNIVNKISGLKLAGLFVAWVLFFLATPSFVIAEDEKPDPTIASARDGDWSDPGTWDKGKLPDPDDVVLISEKTTVRYDMDADEISMIRVQGTLEWDRESSTELLVEHLIVEDGGHLIIGDDQHPISDKAQALIIFRGLDEDQLPGTMDFFLANHGLRAEEGSYLQIAGSPKNPAWTKLAEDALDGSATIVLSEAPIDWEVGDTVLLTETERIPDDKDKSRPEQDDTVLQDTGENELRHILDISGNVVILDEPLEFFHSGTAPANGEVANLSRNIIFTSEDATRRGHTMSTGAFRIQNALFRELGPFGVGGLYPVHLHENVQGWDLVAGNVVMNSGNPAVTIHGLQNTTFRDNVIFNVMGHGFYIYHPDRDKRPLEQTRYNTFDHNLVVRVNPFYLGKATEFSGASPPRDDTDAHSRATAFWLANPNQIVTNNVAVSARHGFTGSYLDQWGMNGLGILEFRNNEAHQCHQGYYEGYVEIPDTTISEFKAWRNLTGLHTYNLSDQNFTVQDSLFFENVQGALQLDYFNRDGVTFRNCHFRGNGTGGGLIADTAGGEVVGPPLEVENCEFSENAIDLRVRSLPAPQFGRQVQVQFVNSRLESATPIFMPGREPSDDTCAYCDYSLSPTSFVSFENTRFTDPAAAWIDEIGDFSLLPWWMWPDISDDHPCPYVDKEGRFNSSVISPALCK